MCSNNDLLVLILVQEVLLFSVIKKRMLMLMLMMVLVISITLQKTKTRSRRLQSACWAGKWTMEGERISWLQIMIKRFLTTTYLCSPMVIMRWVNFLLLRSSPWKGIWNGNLIFLPCFCLGFWRTICRITRAAFYGISWSAWWKGYPSSSLFIQCLCINIIILFILCCSVVCVQII